jgi:hypothetical protein
VGKDKKLREDSPCRINFWKWLNSGYITMRITLAPTGIGAAERDMGLDEIGLILERLAGEAVLPNQDVKQVLMLLKAQPASH